MKYENIIALLALAAISIVGIAVLPEGAGKDIALALGGAIGGFLTKGALDKPTP